MVKFVNYYIEKRFNRMRILSLTASALFMLLAAGVSLNAQDYRDALRLYDNSMFSRSRTLFDEEAGKSLTSDPEGRSVLSQIRSVVPGYETSMESFISRNPQTLWPPAAAISSARLTCA